MQWQAKAEFDKEKRRIEEERQQSAGGAASDGNAKSGEPSESVPEA